MDNIRTEILKELQSITIPRKNATNTRRGFPIGHRSMTLGITKGRFNGHIGLSYYSKKYPRLYLLCKMLGESVCTFPFTSIHINHNVECPPHYDAGNADVTCIVIIGNYTGGELIIEGREITNTTEPIIFDGRKQLHWSLPVTFGDKYSIVFF